MLAHSADGRGSDFGCVGLVGAGVADVSAIDKEADLDTGFPALCSPTALALLQVTCNSVPWRFPSEVDWVTVWTAVGIYTP